MTQVIIKSNLSETVFAMRKRSAQVERSVADELHVLASKAANRMRELAAKGASSNLVNSIKPDQMGRFTWHIGPHTTYDAFVEFGVKPGGKGLPRFFDPKSKSIVDWLASHPSRKAMGPHAPGKKRRGPRKGSKVFTANELELRDRYQGLRFSIRRFGVKAQPFVEPVAREFESVALAQLTEAVRKAMA